MIIESGQEPKIRLLKRFGFFGAYSRCISLGIMEALFLLEVERL
jgi:hypothetical protein